MQLAGVHGLKTGKRLTVDVAGVEFNNHINGRMHNSSSSLAKI
jgi:hypothetical protein